MNKKVAVLMVIIVISTLVLSMNVSAYEQTYNTYMKYISNEDCNPTIEFFIQEGIVMSKEYNFHYEGKNWHINAEFFQDMVLEEINNVKCRNASDEQYIRLKDFVMTEGLDNIYKQILSQDANITKEEYAKLIIYFVQSQIQSCLDIENYNTTEYFALPYETLLTGKGDCEDCSILIVSLLKSIGIDSVLIVTTGHALVGVPILDLPQLNKEVQEIEYANKTMHTKLGVPLGTFEARNTEYAFLEATHISPLGYISYSTYNGLCECFYII